MTDKNRTPMDMCPMAAVCRGMSGKSGTGSGLLLMVPGILLVLGGVLVLTVPQALVWLMGGTSILIGIVVLVFANLIRKVSAGTGEG